MIALKTVTICQVMLMKVRGSSYTQNEIEYNGISFMKLLKDVERPEIEEETEEEYLQDIIIPSDVTADMFFSDPLETVAFFEEMRQIMIGLNVSCAICKGKMLIENQNDFSEQSRELCLKLEFAFRCSSDFTKKSFLHFVENNFCDQVHCSSTLKTFSKSFFSLRARKEASRDIHSSNKYASKSLKNA